MLLLMHWSHLSLISYLFFCFVRKQNAAVNALELLSLISDFFILENRHLNTSEYRGKNSGIDIQAMVLRYCSQEYIYSVLCSVYAQYNVLFLTCITWYWNASLYKFHNVLVIFFVFLKHGIGCSFLFYALKLIDQNLLCWWWRMQFTGLEINLSTD